MDLFTKDSSLTPVLKMPLMLNYDVTRTTITRVLKVKAILAEVVITIQDQVVLIVKEEEVIIIKEELTVEIHHLAADITVEVMEEVCKIMTRFIVLFLLRHHRYRIMLFNM